VCECVRACLRACVRACVRGQADKPKGWSRLKAGFTSVLKSSKLRTNLGDYANTDAQRFTEALTAAYTKDVAPKLAVMGTNKGTFFQQLRQGDEEDITKALVTEGKKGLTIVAHSGVGRVRFACFLPDFVPTCVRPDALLLVLCSCMWFVVAVVGVGDVATGVRTGAYPGRRDVDDDDNNNHNKCVAADTCTHRQQAEPWNFNREALRQRRVLAPENRRRGHARLAHQRNGLPRRAQGRGFFFDDWHGAAVGV
jgi:hypothetical protein